ncbi:DUF5694 domain-containing protein [Pedobacter sp. PWIIR3]
MKLSHSLSHIILLLIAFTFNSNAQIEIVIVGSSHNNAASAQGYQPIIDKFKNFKPDMVFGEYLPGSDYNKLDADNWAKQAFQKGYDYLAKRNPVEFKSLKANVKKSRKALSSFAYYHKLRMNLALASATQWDRGNTEYQIFILENYMKKAFSKEELAVYAKMFGSQDSLKRAGLYRPGSEYSNIYFPLIYQLKQDQIYNMDCQTYDKPWSEAWGKVDSLDKILSAKAKADPLSAEANTVNQREAYMNYSAEESKVFNADPYAGMNTAKYGELDEAWNFYGGSKFYGYPGFPTAEVKDMIAQWMLRNEGMCKNIIEQAKAKKAKRIVVAVGASHRKWMENILAKNKEVKIVNYNDL